MFISLAFFISDVWLYTQIFYCQISHYWMSNESKLNTLSLAKTTLQVWQDIRYMQYIASYFEFPGLKKIWKWYEKWPMVIYLLWLINFYVKYISSNNYPFLNGPTWSTKWSYLVPLLDINTLIFQQI